jgi:nucleoside 2-deoxyribosyltransferase
MLELHKKVWLWSPVFSPDQDHEFSMKDYTMLDEQLAMHLIEDVKKSLQDRRENGWEPLLKKVKAFYEKNEIRKLMLEGHLDKENKR